MKNTHVTIIWEYKDHQNNEEGIIFDITTPCAPITAAYSNPHDISDTTFDICYECDSDVNHVKMAITTHNPSKQWLEYMMRDEHQGVGFYKTSDHDLPGFKTIFRQDGNPLHSLSAQAVIELIRNL